MANTPTWYTYGTGVVSSYGSWDSYDSWDTDDEEAMQTPPSWSRHFCSSSGHEWVDTGTKWTYCKHCDAEGMWDMKNGYQLSDRNRSKSE